jgi:hypothetical protein
VIVVKFIGLPACFVVCKYCISDNNASHTLQNTRPTMAPKSLGTDKTHGNYRLRHDITNSHMSLQVHESSVLHYAAAPPRQMELAGHVLPARPYWIKPQIRGSRFRNVHKKNTCTLPVQPHQVESAALPAAMDPDWDEVSCVLLSLSHPFLTVSCNYEVLLPERCPRESCPSDLGFPGNITDTQCLQGCAAGAASPGRPCCSYSRCVNGIRYQSRALLGGQ